MNVAAIIPAAGQGRRMKEKINKQYLQLDRRPILSHTLKACLDSAAFSQIIVVVTPGEEELFRRDVLLPWFPHSNIIIATGGKERQNSVRNALAVLEDEIEYVCVHDGVRPLADVPLILNCLEKAKEHGAVIAAVPVKDTIKQVDSNGQVLSTPDRQTLWAVQTPQVFRRDWLESAHQQAQKEGLQATDDAALLEHYGHPVFVVCGSYANLKVTTPEDLILAHALMGRVEEMRIGTGYDVHRLVADRPLILGGVTIPYEIGLLGHSDADVLVHAIMDAMLGALALGDLGKHFPDTDPVYKGISSRKLLQHVGEIKKWLQVYVKRFYAGSQFKRSVMPNGPKIGSGGSLSPRGDWRAPSDSSAAPWLTELERIPDTD